MQCFQNSLTVLFFHIMLYIMCNFEVVYQKFAYFSKSKELPEYLSLYLIPVECMSFGQKHFITLSVIAAVNSKRSIYCQCIIF